MNQLIMNPTNLAAQAMALQPQAVASAAPAETPPVVVADPATNPATPLKNLLSKPRTADVSQAPALQPHIAAITLGRLQAVDGLGQAWVQWPTGLAQPSMALSLVAVNAADVGRQVALSFPNGAEQPLLLGLVWSAGNVETELAASSFTEPLSAEIDGETVQLTAQESLVLRCGKASITLTADGQILLRGAYISSHSTGTQRIKGAAVRIN